MFWFVQNISSLTLSSLSAHCVHTGLRCNSEGTCAPGSWLWGNFSPAQYRTSSDVTVQPYGRWYARTMTTYYGWTNGYKAWQYDIAVVRLFQNGNGYDIGNYIGYAGMKETNIPLLNSDPSGLATSGYPSDKSGQEMWRSPCWNTTDWFEVSWSQYVVGHYCDITYGNSGGSIMDDQAYTYGVQSFHGSYNGAVILFDSRFDDVLRWARG